MRNDVIESFTYSSLLAQDNLDERKTFFFSWKNMYVFKWSFSFTFTCKIITQANLKIIERRWQIKPFLKSKDTPGVLARRM